MMGGGAVDDEYLYKKIVNSLFKKMLVVLCVLV